MGILVFRDSDQGNLFVGRIDYVAGADAAFQYDATYLASKKPLEVYGISQRLPLHDAPYDSNEFSSFSTKMAFNIGKHRNLEDIDPNDIMSIPLDLDIPLQVFDEIVARYFQRWNRVM